MPVATDELGVRTLGGDLEYRMKTKTARQTIAITQTAAAHSRPVFAGSGCAPETANRGIGESTFADAPADKSATSVVAAVSAASWKLGPGIWDWGVTAMAGSLLNFGHKAIAATRDRHDVVVRAGRFAKDLPQFRDRLREIVLLNNGIWPNRLHDPLLVQHSVVVLDHKKKRIEYSRRQGNRRPVQSP